MSGLSSNLNQIIDFIAISIRQSATCAVDFARLEDAHADLLSYKKNRILNEMPAGISLEEKKKVQYKNTSDLLIDDIQHKCENMVDVYNSEVSTFNDASGIGCKHLNQYRPPYLTTDLVALDKAMCMVTDADLA